MTAADVALPREAPRPAVIRLAALLRERGGSFAAGMVFLAVSTLAGAIAPQLIRAATNAIVARDTHAAARFAGFIAIAAIVGAVMRVASRIYIFNIGRDIEFDIRSKLLRHLHTLGPSFFRKVPPGEVMSRATNDIAQVRLLLGFGVLNVVNVVVAYAGNLPLMVYRSPSLTLVTLLPFPVVIFVVRMFSRAMFRRSRATQDALGELSDRAQQTLSGMRVVRAYQLEKFESEAFDHISLRALEANLALARLRGTILPIVGAAGGISSLLVLWEGGRQVLAGRLTVGDILAFQAHLALVTWPTIALGYLMSIVQRARASVERLNEILGAEPDVRDEDARAASEIHGALRVDGLHYEIDGRVILEDVSFDVPAGGSIAIVGKTGSGKSTLSALLVRMLPTPRGTVFLDEHDITTMPLGQLRAAANLAQQEPFLFSTTIARNIGFSTDDPDAPATNDRIRHAAGEAQILREAETMTDGLNTIVGERGVQLSGGQKQRVALARALLVAPSVLILDDPMSAIDARTEVAILDAIERAAVGRTLVLVTHRIAAASRCKSIVVLDAGRVVERGTHDELVARGGIYARLAEHQALEAELESM